MIYAVWVFGIIMIIYLTVVVYFFVTQKSRIFNKKFAKAFTPERAVQLWFIAKDGTKLEGAFVHNKLNAPFVLYFSGNSNNILEFLDNIAPDMKKFNFIGFNYPGYAGSEGKPCEKCIYRYALEIFDKFNPDFVIGRSLGSAVASYVAAKRDVKGLILITPIDSIVNIAKKRYSFLPVSRLVKEKFETDRYLKEISAPTSVLLVENEDTVPESSIRNVLNSLKNQKEVKTLEGVGHGNVYEYPGISDVIENLLVGLN